jgi:hypothetical protein
MSRPPQKLVIDNKGEEQYVDLEGDELAEYNERQKAKPEPEPPTLEQRMADALDELPDHATFADIRSTLVSKLRGE